LVVGQVLRFHMLCTSTLDIHDRMRRLHWRLRQRGYNEETLFPYFQRGLVRAHNFLALPLQIRLATKKRSTSDPNSIFFHLKFHPEDPPSRTIQALWRQTIQQPIARQPFDDLPSPNGQNIGINRLVVAYSRHLNLINTFSIRRFDRLNGPSVSSFDLHNDDREEAVTT
jgi:hypothetical protein